MGKVDAYKDALRSVDDWDEYLMANSGLPGPRGNIELGMAAGDVASVSRIRRWLAWDAHRAPTNSPKEFLAFCGVIGLGRLAVEGDPNALGDLEISASDPRWRVREAVAMALQRYGDDHFDRLADAMRDWAEGTCLQQRAAAAALCEPRLLTDHDRVARVIEILDLITASMIEYRDRKDEDFKTLRKGMGYCWSVAVAAAPDPGKPAMERWVLSEDPDVRWVMRANLGKKRLERIDPDWVKRQLSALTR